MSKRRVVVTGMGVICPVGNDVATTWASLLEGQSGIDLITHFDAENFSVKIAGEVKNFNLDKYLSPKEARHMSPFIHYGVAAGMDAIKDSGLDLNTIDLERVGVLIGSGIGGLSTIEHNHAEFVNKGPRRISPFMIPQTVVNMTSGHLSIMYGFKGPNLAISTACTTGTHSIGEAFRMIQYDEADVMIAGGSEGAVSALGIGGFANMKALSTRNDDPKTASRPWDVDRDGFVMGEGGGVLVLESYEHAAKRGARIYAELVGYGRSADANHMTAPCADGDGAKRAMDLALRDARVLAEDVNYINAHGTSTPLGDVAEVLAIKRSFGDHAKRLVVNSTKSMVGHLLGAAGGVEAVFTVLSIYHQKSPPTINIFQQDPSCDLDFCSTGARDMTINYGMSNSFGFGGTNGTLLFKKI